MAENPPGHDEYITANISYVGFVDQIGLEGILILKTRDGKEFPMRAFSGEVARHILRFQEGDKTTLPTIYNLVEEISADAGFAAFGGKNISKWFSSQS